MAWSEIAKNLADYKLIDMGAVVSVSGPSMTGLDPEWPWLLGVTYVKGSENLCFRDEVAANETLKAFRNAVMGIPPDPPLPIPSDVERLMDAMEYHAVPDLPEASLQAIVELGIDRSVLDMFMAAWNQVNSDGYHG